MPSSSAPSASSLGEVLLAGLDLAPQLVAPGGGRIAPRLDQNSQRPHSVTSKEPTKRSLPTGSSGADANRRLPGPR